MAAPLSAAYALFENGEVMNREEFHRRHRECEDLQRVELIEGVVYLPSPTSVRKHGRRQGLVLLWLYNYEEQHEGVVEACPPGTVFLDDMNEPEPDAMMYYVREGQFADDDGNVDEDGDYLLGAPELVVEVANSTRSKDLHQKKTAYERNGVLEYIVWRVRDNAIDWFQLRERKYVQREPGPDGVIESEVFPGLRLDVPAMLAMDRKRVLAAIT